jgi:DNA-binding response OmpR family regulator
MHWGPVPGDWLNALIWAPSLEVLVFDAHSPGWIPLAHRMTGLVVAAATDPLAALCYVVTAGMRLPLVMAIPARSWVSRADLLEAGADDCVRLPLDDAGIAAMLLHFHPRAGSAQVDRITRLVLDPLNRSAIHHGQQVRLAPREFALLQCLSAHSGAPVSAEELLMLVWGTRPRNKPRQILEVTIHELRLKLGRIGFASAVRTVRRYGYALGGITASGRDAVAP